MVRSAAQLIRRRGVSATGMREIVLEADAPRGSLQHYFPDGKEELVREALSWMGGVAARRVRRHAERLDSGPPSELFAAILGDWRRDLTEEGFAAGCPLVAATVDTATDSDAVRELLAEAFEGWQEPLVAALVQRGVPVGRAASLAMVAISALEGAIILSRLRRDLTAFDAVVNELGPLFDAAAEAA
jgi:AcrR family transcriptional regulator